MPDTCLGCGCACDDIEVQTSGGRIVEARRACALGVAWFGDGVVPTRVQVAGRDAALEEALDAAVTLLADARRPLVYLAPDISCETQREAIAVADILRAALDSPTSSTAIGSILASQELGRASATLGEIRNRADVVVFWGVDPAERYPRYSTRYAPEPAGVHVPDGSRSRTVIAVDIGERRGPATADLRMSLGPEDEVAALADLRTLSNPAAASAEDVPQGSPLATILAARYVAIVADAEPDSLESPRDPGRAAALVLAAQALNARTRAALSTLRAGGNRSGADACVTSHTGYPAAVDFSRGFPRYRPYDGSAAARLARRECDALLVVGSASAMAGDVMAAAEGVPAVLVGPRASESTLAGSAVVIDTGVAGIHEGGTALRMDDVPLPLGTPLTGPATAFATVSALRARLVAATVSRQSRVHFSPQP
jgi:formylmethanofuran dehydrogenase subunit B